MKRFLAFILLLTLLIVTGTIVSAEGRPRTAGTVLSGTAVATVITEVTSIQYQLEF